MFQKDDYIVVLELKNIGEFTQCAKNDYIFKQKNDAQYIIPYIDLSGSDTNANDTLLYNKTANLLDWRYATQEEIALYELNGKPCSITELLKNTKPVAEDFDYLIEIFTKLNIK